MITPEYTIASNIALRYGWARRDRCDYAALYRDNFKQPPITALWNGQSRRDQGGVLGAHLRLREHPPESYRGLKSGDWSGANDFILFAKA